MAPEQITSTIDIAAVATAVREAADRIRDLVTETRVVEISDLAPGSNVRLFAKLENEQETGSFKLRGASNKIALLSEEDRARGVTTASNGNHALGLALAAKKTGTRAEVFVSTLVAPERAARVRSLGAVVTTAGANPLDAEKAARIEGQQTGRVFISPYNDPQIIAGQGTTAVELLRQLPSMDAVFITTGGGGLLGGMGAYLKQAAPNVEIVACWPENSCVLYQSLQAGRIVEAAEEKTLSDSSAGGVEEGSITFPIAQSVIDRKVLVTEDEILSAMRLVLRERGWVIEGAAAVALAAFLKTSSDYAGKTVAVLLCGGNVSAWVKELL